MSDPSYYTQAVTIASGGSISSAFDLFHNYDHVYILIPANTWNTEIYMSDKVDGTFYPAANHGGTTDSYASSISGKYCQITNHGRYNKIRATTAPANGTTYTVVCFN